MRFSKKTFALDDKYLHFNRDSKPLPGPHILEEATVCKLKYAYEILSMQTAESGQSKTLFIQLKQGSFLLKPSADTPLALFYNRLAQLLGVSTPQIKYLTYQDSITAGLINSIKNQVYKSGLSVYGKLGDSLTHCLYQTIEYVPSIAFPECPPQIFAEYLLTQDRFVELGICIAFDLIINNNDRFQLVWGGEGNLDNILIQVQKKLDPKSQEEVYYPVRYVFIDHIGNLCNIDEKIIAENADRYFKKITVFFQQIFTLKDLKEGTHSRAQTLKGTFLQRFAKQFQLYTQHRLAQQEIIVIIKAILRTTQAFMREFKDGKVVELLEDLYNEDTKKKMDQFCVEQWRGALARVNINFCQEYYKAIAEMMGDEGEM